MEVADPTPIPGAYEEPLNDEIKLQNSYFAIFIQSGHNVSAIPVSSSPPSKGQDCLRKLAHKRIWAVLSFLGVAKRETGSRIHRCWRTPHGISLRHAVNSFFDDLGELDWPLVLGSTKPCNDKGSINLQRN
jgi:hypothetical protein